MRAARLHDHSQRLVIEDVPVPEVRDGWVLLKVEAAGLCHTDIHVMHGAQFSTRRGEDYTVGRPITLGHEVAGTVVDVGPNVDENLIGRRAAAGGWAGPGTTPGMHFDGGFAEYCLVPAGKLVKVPDAVDIDIAAVATDSIKTAYAAVTRAAQVRAGESVAIIGLGGLGMSALRTAVLLGATVYGVDVNDKARARALAAGATGCSATVEGLGDLVVADAAAHGAEAPGTAHEIAAAPDFAAALDFVGGATTAAALDLVHAGGRVVLVGLGAADLVIDAQSLVLGRKTLIGSLGSTFTSDFEEVLAELARGNLTPEIEVIDFENLNDGYERLSKGLVTGRLVLHPSPAA